MTGPVQQQPTYHRAADVARLLKCSAWWVKEQARRGRIPYCWIGGSYLFTDEHVREIVRLHEVQPVDLAATRSAPRRSASPTGEDRPGSVVQLKARMPRRLRAFAEGEAA
jgi:hypothetical protein